MVLGSDSGMPETIARQWVTSGTFDVLGLLPVAGRLFTDDDDRDRARLVVLNERFWRERYNSDSSIIGTPRSNSAPPPALARSRYQGALG